MLKMLKKEKRQVFCQISPYGHLCVGREKARQHQIKKVLDRARLYTGEVC